MQYPRSAALAALAALVPGSLASAQTEQEEALVLTASDAQAEDAFSAGLALDGDRLAVGAARADVGPDVAETDEGAVYVFERDGAGWTEQTLLQASDAAPGDALGSQVDLEGPRLLAAAPQADQTTDGDEGAAYVFALDDGIWAETAKLVASDAAPGDGFGAGVRLEGDRAFVGAPGADAPLTTLGDEGAVYVFAFDGSAWVEVQKLVASEPGEQDRFGAWLDVDGDRLVVGASGEDDGVLSDSGAAYVFEYDGVTWVEVAKLLPGVRRSDQRFGASCSIDGDRLVVGADGDRSPTGVPLAGTAYLFEHDGAAWNETATLNASDAQLYDAFGTACWLQGDFVVVGAPGENSGNVDAGAAYLYEYDGATWTEIAKLVASDGSVADALGHEVVVQGDTVLASSRKALPLIGSRAGGAYAFDTSVNAATTHADLVAAPRSGQNPLVVHFTDATVGGATSWSWDFGDGNTSTERHPTHTYYEFGTFDVSLAVTAALGDDAITKTGLIVADPLPASATIRNGSGTNALCYQPVTDPVIGQTLTTEVDATNHPSAGLTFVVGYDVPLTGLPTPYGELLVAPEPLGGFFAYGTVVDSMGGVATHSSDVPTDVTFVGIRLYTQAVILGGAGPELCNAIDLLIGW